MELVLAAPSPSPLQQREQHNNFLVSPSFLFGSPETIESAAASAEVSGLASFQQQQQQQAARTNKRRRGSDENAYGISQGEFFPSEETFHSYQLQQQQIQAQQQQQQQLNQNALASRRQVKRGRDDGILDESPASPIAGADVYNDIPMYSQRQVNSICALHEKEIETVRRREQEACKSQATTLLSRALEEFNKERERLQNENKVLKQGFATLHHRHAELAKELEQTQKALREEREKLRQFEIIFRARSNMQVGNCRRDDFHDSLGGGGGGGVF